MQGKLFAATFRALKRLRAFEISDKDQPQQEVNKMNYWHLLTSVSVNIDSYFPFFKRYRYKCHL